MNWDHYDYKIADHYLSALINGDTSGLDDSESAALLAWEQSEQASARRAGFTVGHWDCDVEYSDDFGPCDVSGLYADRCAVRLMVYRNG